jgi:hypothetical protein
MSEGSSRFSANEEISLQLPANKRFGFTGIVFFFIRQSAEQCEAT